MTGRLLYVFVGMTIKKKKNFKNSEKSTLRKGKICFLVLPWCGFFCTFVGTDGEMSDDINFSGHMSDV